MAYHVYVLLDPQGKLYIGQTSDLPRRLSQHNEPTFHGTLHTKRHPGPWRLIHQESFPSRRAAIGRKRELKSDQGRDWTRRTLLGGACSALGRLPATAKGRLSAPLPSLAPSS